MSFTSIDPTTGEALDSYDPTPTSELDGIVQAADEAHRPWRDAPFSERARCLRAMAALLRERSDTYSGLMTAEMGKPIAQARAEVEKCAWAAEYYADEAEEHLAPVRAETEARGSYWTYRPLGVVLAVMPWNFPFWQVIRFTAPALTAGNAGLLSHSSNVPGCARALEQLVHDAGFPPDLFRNLFVDNDTTGDLIEHPLVRAVSVTGSVRAGKAVAERAGRVLKKCVLELGGSDPSVVLADADLDATVAACVQGRLQNTGQSCIAAKRFVLVDEIHDAFLERMLDWFRNSPMGDPRDEDTVLGPMAREDLRDELHRQVEASVREGARLLVGGKVPDRPGAWYPATVLGGVGPGMPAYDEELFGPVAAVIRARDEEDAIRIANDTNFGLGASIYTGDLEKGERIARDRLEAGNCFVNTFVKSHPRLPFGGIKDSGYGRELSPLGIREFTNVKTVWVE